MRSNCLNNDKEFFLYKYDAQYVITRVTVELYQAALSKTFICDFPKSRILWLQPRLCFNTYSSTTYEHLENSISCKTFHASASATKLYSFRLLDFGYFLFYKQFSCNKRYYDT
jgi:hypothetical protein